MSGELQIVAALFLDLVLGDPSGYPHPVRLIGHLATQLHRVTTKSHDSLLLAGILTGILTVSTSVLTVLMIIWVAGLVHPLVKDVVSTLILYTCFSAKDLASHALRVQKNLQNGDLLTARRSVSWMVGRKTDKLTEVQVCKATIESVAENLVDGVTAPIFFALLGGPVATVAFKAASTLDSMFGYKNEQFMKFGWFPARFDDLLNFVPARLTAPVIAAAAVGEGTTALGAIRILRRDRRNHPSPNSGIPEAAFAGALGLQLGGPIQYANGIANNPTIGDPVMVPHATHIQQAITLMFKSTLIFVSIGVALTGVIKLWGGWQ